MLVYCYGQVFQTLLLVSVAMCRIVFADSSKGPWNHSTCPIPGNRCCIFVHGRFDKIDVVANDARLIVAAYNGDPFSEGTDAFVPDFPIYVAYVNEDTSGGKQYFEKFGNPTYSAQWDQVLGLHHALFIVKYPSGRAPSKSAVCADSSGIPNRRLNFELGVRIEEIVF